MTKHLYLTSSVEIPGIAADIRHKIGGSSSLKTVFIMTPAEAGSEANDLSWLDGEREMLNSAGFTTFDYSITGKSEQEIRTDLASIDVLYVSGGNDFYFKQEANKCGFGEFVRKFVESGKPYISSSCGSVIMGTDISPMLQLSDLKDLDDPDNPDLTGFGIVNFTILPHWGSDDFRDSYLHSPLTTIYDCSAPMIALNNNQYVEVVDDQFQIIDISKS